MENTRSVAGVVVIDDHLVLAGGLKAALNMSQDLRVVATAATIAEGLDRVSRWQPDLVVADYRLPDGDIVDHMDAILERCPGTKVLVITGWPDENSLLQTMSSGAGGFIDKAQEIDEVISAARRVLKGELVVSPRFLPLLARRAQPATADAGALLSARELEVLGMLADGLSTREMADSLHLSVNTVRNHVARLLAKLHARSRLDAVRAGVESGLIRFDPGGSSSGR